jgi:hypothetical protein
MFRGVSNNTIETNIIPDINEINREVLVLQYALIVLVFGFMILFTNELIHLYNKDKTIFTTKVKDVYNKLFKDNHTILPLTGVEKSSPFITPNLNMVLPSCSSLDSAEKGSNIRNRSLIVSRVTNFDVDKPISITTETKFTIFKMPEGAVSPKTNDVVNFTQSV